MVSGNVLSSASVPPFARSTWTRPGPSSRPRSPAPWTGSKRSFGHGEQHDETLRSADACHLVAAAWTICLLHAARTHQRFCCRLSHIVLSDDRSPSPGTSGLSVVSGNAEVSASDRLSLGCSGFCPVSHLHLV